MSTRGEQHLVNAIFMWSSSIRQQSAIVFTTVLPDRGRFRICSTVNVFKRMSTLLPLSSRRVTAALVGLLRSLLLDRFRNM